MTSNKSFKRIALRSLLTWNQSRVPVHSQNSAIPAPVRQKAQPVASLENHRVKFRPEGGFWQISGGIQMRVPGKQGTLMTSISRMHVMVACWPICITPRMLDDTGFKCTYYLSSSCIRGFIVLWPKSSSVARRAQFFMTRLKPTKPKGEVQAIMTLKPGML